jgi:hypothetical protein
MNTPNTTTTIPANENTNAGDFSTRYDMQMPHLQISTSEMTPAWRRVQADLIARGFTVAASHMRDIMRLSTPRAYWLGAGNNGLKASI